MADKWELAHEIGARLACLEWTPAVGKLILAANEKAPTILSRVRFAVKSLSPGVELPADLAAMIEDLAAAEVAAAL